MTEKKESMVGCNEIHLCEKEAHKAFQLYFQRLMPTTEVIIASITLRDYQFIIKIKNKTVENKND